MKEGEEEKTKTYSALVWTDKAIQKEDIAFLDDIKVSVALFFFFANLFSTWPGVLGEILYTCTHGHTSFLWLVFCLIRVPFAIQLSYLFSLSPFSLLVCYKLLYNSDCPADQIRKSREWERGKSGTHAPFFTLDCFK